MLNNLTKIYFYNNGYLGIELNISLLDDQIM